jgi:hypothetical protein
MSMQEAISVETVRELCLRLPETNERPSHGHPAFFIRDKKSFVTYMDNHHGSGHKALWCAAPEGIQEMLVSASPEHYFRPPYVGHRGWIGVYLDTGIDEYEVAGVIEDAYLTVAPKSLVKSVLESQDLRGAR